MNKYTCIKTLNGHDHTVSAVEFLPNSDLLLSCSRDATIKLWETNSGFCKKTYKGHNKWVRDLKINKSGDTFATCGDDEQILLWDYEKNDPKMVLEGHENVVTCLLFLMNDKSKYIVSKSYYFDKANR